MRRISGLVRQSPRTAVLVAVLALGIISCTQAPRQREDLPLYPGWQGASQAGGRSVTERHPTPTRRDLVTAPERRPVPPEARVIHKEVTYEPLKVEMPTIQGAEFVGENDLCMTCHEPFTQRFQGHNVHSQQRCEDCHGPASQHVITRGMETGTVLSFKRLKPAERSEICLKCHEQDKAPHVAQWRTSAHAHRGVSCTDCHTAHYEVPKGTPLTASSDQTAKPQRKGDERSPAHAPSSGSDREVLKAALRAQDAAAPNGTPEQPPNGQPSLRGTSRNLGAVAPDVCYRCHQDAYQLQQLTGPHQVGGKSGFNCTSCHDPHGNVTARTKEELCLSCHKGPLSGDWHAARHNEAGLQCTDCHDPHPSVGPETFEGVQQGQLSLAGLPQPMDAPRDACYRCHGDSYRLQEFTGPHRIAPGTEFDCATCHDPHKSLTAQTREDVCLNCHKGPLPGIWHASPHDQAGLVCTTCHDPHPSVDPRAIAELMHGRPAKVPQPMDVAEARVCVQCHKEADQIVAVAGPHQVGGVNNIQCSTCHDPHGKIRDRSRKELCLDCHRDSPTTAWHSSIHDQQGVMCTDCHHPHPNSHVQRDVDIRHTNVRRPERLPMAVLEPDACYKCHPKTYGQSVMPSHHPIFEGKMVCSDCHDAHGQALGLLKEPTVNLVCYKCHAEVQGPFVYEHPPATEDCTICHNPHGSVTNNLLHQPTTFLCLRCHSGHRTGPPDHDRVLLPDIGRNPQLQAAFFSDCTECHSQIHGSNVPSPRNPRAYAR